LKKKKTKWWKNNWKEQSIRQRKLKQDLLFSYFHNMFRQQSQLEVGFHIVKKVDSYRIVKAMTYRIVKAMTSGPLLSSRFYLFDEQIVGGQILALEDL